MDQPFHLLNQKNKLIMIIAIGADHAGFELKQELIDYLQKINIETKDCGTYNTDRADYPDFGHAVAHEVAKQSVQCGILICGSGNGINMTANKHTNIRAALCWTPEIALLARQHNNANILSLPARFISKEDAKKCVVAFINTTFEAGRHLDRINKINV